MLYHVTRSCKGPIEVLHGLTSSGYVYSLEKTLQFKQQRQKPIVLQLKVDRYSKLINDKITKMEYNHNHKNQAPLGIVSAALPIMAA